MIKTGEILKNESRKSTATGEKIKACLANHESVDDDIVVDLVSKNIQATEKAKKSWLIEGFPRTRVQALSIQKMGIVPDKFVQL